MSKSLIITTFYVRNKPGCPAVPEAPSKPVLTAPHELCQARAQDAPEQAPRVEVTWRIRSKALQTAAESGLSHVWAMPAPHTGPSTHEHCCIPTFFKLKNLTAKQPLWRIQNYY